MNIIPLPYRIGAILLLIVGALYFAFSKGKSYERAKWEAKVQKAEMAAAKASVRAAKLTVDNIIASRKIEVRYVDRIKEVERPVPVVRRVLVDRVCPGARDAVPRAAGVADPGATADADAGRDSAGLAADLISCKQNAEQLRSLTEWVRQNSSR